jgi:hypothetical protein
MIQTLTWLSSAVTNKPGVTLTTKDQYVGSWWSSLNFTINYIEHTCKNYTAQYDKSLQVNEIKCSAILYLYISKIYGFVTMIQCTNIANYLD